MYSTILGKAINQKKWAQRRWWRHVRPCWCVTGLITQKVEGSMISISSGWWARATPLKNMSSSVGMMRFPIWMGKCQIHGNQLPPTSHEWKQFRMVIWHSNAFDILLVEPCWAMARPSTSHLSSSNIWIKTLGQTYQKHRTCGNFTRHAQPSRTLRPQNPWRSMHILADPRSYRVWAKVQAPGRL